MAKKENKTTTNIKRKYNLQLKDGETKFEKTFINPFTNRIKTQPDTTPKITKDLQNDFKTPAPYHHGIDINSFGVDRNDIQKYLNRKENIAAVNNSDQIMESICNLKNQTEFRKEFPKVVEHKTPLVRIYKNDVHSKITAGGYGRNEFGRPYFS